MSGEIAKAVLVGARVLIAPDCFPCLGKAKYIQVNMMKQTWNGIVTLSRKISIDVTPEQIDAAIVEAVREMAEAIDLPHNGRGDKR